MLRAEAAGIDAVEAIGVDLIQFDEPAFNVFLDDVKEWGIEALHRAIEGLTCTTAVHICYGYGIEEDGFETAEAISHAKLRDLDGLNMKRGHVRLLLARCGARDTD